MSDDIYRLHLSETAAAEWEATGPLSWVVKDERLAAVREGARKMEVYAPRARLLHAIDLIPVGVKPLPFVMDDGGRAAAGFNGAAGDCVTRAIAIATGKPYAEVYALVNEEARRERPGAKRRKGRRSSARTGVFKPTTRRLMESLGWKWVPTMHVGQGAKVHLRDGELPGGRLVVAVSKHLCAVVDGVVRDTHDPCRGGMRCVYGYWMAP